MKLHEMAAQRLLRGSLKSGCPHSGFWIDLENVCNQLEGEIICLILY